MACSGLGTGGWGDDIGQTILGLVSHGLSGLSCSRAVSTADQREQRCTSFVGGIRMGL